MMSKKMVAIIGVLVIVALVVGAIIGSLVSQARATTTLSAAAEQQHTGSPMPDNCPGENHATHHRDMHGEDDAHHSGAMYEDCPGENHDTHHRDMHEGSDAHHSGMRRH